jgi:uncharacterized NAD(P)/FAD-binding protein YdhS
MTTRPRFYAKRLFASPARRDANPSIFERGNNFAIGLAYSTNEAQLIVDALNAYVEMPVVARDDKQPEES